MTFLAGTVINNVRDLYPDPIYSAGVPLPDADGQWFRAATLYRWLDDGCRLMVTRLGWTLTDWWAMPTVANQGVYSISPLWQLLDQAYADRLQLEVVPQSEARAIYPGASFGDQPNRAYVFRLGDHLDVGFDPTPNYADPATPLNGAINAAVTTFALTSSSGFLPSGYALIGSELVRYASLSGNSLLGVTRGWGGTTAAVHADQVTATHCGLWIKGARVPTTITSSTSIVEVPLAWVSLLNLYLLATMKMFSQETQEFTALMKAFDEGCGGIAKQIGGIAARDPITRRLGADRKDGGVPPPMVTESAQIQSSG